MDKTALYTQIQSLKATKKGTAKNSCAIELIRNTGYMNIVDMLLLPLRTMKFGTLEDVRFETYLKRAYERYCHFLRAHNVSVTL